MSELVVQYCANVLNIVMKHAIIINPLLLADKAHPLGLRAAQQKTRLNPSIVQPSIGVKVKQSERPWGKKNVM